MTANACLVVTHDRYFLENVANRVTEIDPAYPQGTFGVKGNYSEFLVRRQEFLDADSKQQESLANKVRREVEWLQRGPKARTGKSRARINSAGKLIDELAESTARGRKGSVRIDFTAAGTVLNWVTAREAEGRQVQFSDVHRLVAAFFNVIGISEHARITIRNE